MRGKRMSIPLRLFKNNHIYKVQSTINQNFLNDFDSEPWSTVNLFFFSPSKLHFRGWVQILLGRRTAVSH